MRTDLHELTTLVAGCSDETLGQLLKEMREWISDCTWADLEPDDVDELADTEVLAGVRQHYVGGLAQFVRDSDPS